jgi:hypothetical protein
VANNGSNNASSFPKHVEEINLSFGNLKLEGFLSLNGAHSRVIDFLMPATINNDLCFALRHTNFYAGSIFCLLSSLLIFVYRRKSPSSRS